MSVALSVLGTVQSVVVGCGGMFAYHSEGRNVIGLTWTIGERSTRRARVLGVWVLLGRPLPSRKRISKYRNCEDD